MLTFVYKSNEGDRSGVGCMKEAKLKVSFFITSSSSLTSLMSSVNRWNGSGDGGVTNHPIKIL